MRKILCLCLLFALALPLWATHQRAAEITYTWKGGNTYEFTLTCYTYSPSLAGVQRDSLLMQWGDGFAEYVPRVVFQDLGDDYTLNVYRTTHSYAATGTYFISMEDPDRNFGVVNVPNSVNVPMYIESELVINPFLGYNNSPQLLNAPVDKGCVGKPFYHNPSAYDPDGDSLSYRLVPCKGLNGEDIPGYSFPQASSLFDIDPVTGELQWENPVLQGEFNVAILIEEWRHGQKIGAITRDMQILINACNNNVPSISSLTDTCVVAGTSLCFTVSGSDPDNDVVTLTASGAPFEMASNPAAMNPATVTALHPSFTFQWDTECGHIRKAPYQVVIHAKDNSFPIPLTNVHNINISVIGPPVEGLTAEMGPNGVALAWQPYSCPNAESIRIYRKTGGTPYQPEVCETGVRPGYQLLAELSDLQATSFVDANQGAGFEQGVDYCYRLVAVFHGNNEGVPSEEVCVRQKNDLPLMTQVSNDPADLSAGQVLTSWAKPREMEPWFTAPFSFRLIRNLDGVETTVYQGTDTVFPDRQVNLYALQSLRYQVEMRDANQQVVGMSSPATYLKLTGVGGDATASLSWTESVPWLIDSTQVFREINNRFLRIATTTAMSYVDHGLENEQPYRYYVRTFGHYAVEGVQKPLVNYSAILEVTPTDNEPPEPLILTVEPDCDEVENVLIWRGLVPDDFAGFKIYYTASSTDEFTLVETLTNPMDTSYRHEGLMSTMGCYYMVVFDDKGNHSLPSDTVCIDLDACPVYELPNAFTPNGDGINDVFVPIHVSKVAVEQVKMHIFNRWGRTVFDTTDPYINWDGRASGTKLECPSGTYFYVCEVTIKTPEGPVTQRLQGVIMIIRN